MADQPVTRYGAEDFGHWFLRVVSLRPASEWRGTYLTPKGRENTGKSEPLDQMTPPDAYLFIARVV
jgi:hypothetical protein